MGTFGPFHPHFYCPSASFIITYLTIQAVIISKKTHETLFYRQVLYKQTYSGFSHFFGNYFASENVFFLIINFNALNIIFILGDTIKHNCVLATIPSTKTL